MFIMLPSAIHQIKIRISRKFDKNSKAICSSSSWRNQNIKHSENKAQ